jgi:hypothetical protein
MLALQTVGFVVGAALLAAFVFYFALGFSEPRRSPEALLHRGERVAAISSLLLGAALMGTWAYLMAIGWESFNLRRSELWMHLFTEAASGLVLFVAGVALLRHWSRGPALLMIANGLLLFTTTIALFSFGATGHSLEVTTLTAVLTLGSAALVTLVYARRHFGRRPATGRAEGSARPERGERGRAA